jgi:large subunit ribosomal protein L24
MALKRLEEPVRIRFKKDDVVVVIAGKDKGKEGRVLSVNRWTGRVLVEGVNMVKRHTKPNPAKQIKGGIAERESSIHVSNVMMKGSDGKPVRMRTLVEHTPGGKTRRVRIDARSGASLDKK